MLAYIHGIRTFIRRQLLCHWLRPYVYVAAAVAVTAPPHAMAACYRHRCTTVAPPTTPRRTPRAPTFAAWQGLVKMPSNPNVVD